MGLNNGTPFVMRNSILCPKISVGGSPVFLTVSQLIMSLALVTRMAWLDVRCLTGQFGGDHDQDLLLIQHEFYMLKPLPRSQD